MSEKNKKSRDKYPPLTTPPDPPVPNRAHTEMSLGNCAAGNTMQEGGMLGNFDTTER